MKETHILFICKHNKFRSKVAEAIFKKYNRNSLLKVKSAGIIPGTFLNKSTAAILNEIGIHIRGKPRAVTIPLLAWQDILVIVADNVPPSLFHQKKHGKKLLVWKVHDSSKIHRTGDKKAIHKTTRIIERKVKDLLEEMG